ncbi:tryptophan halogenase family protein [Cellvibrio polysaccharolyticus]|uniref:Tryptophan 7-halogenase n=1 Tax=Cellvibrio polysaccharolyticus TaxID=2082724 RepID=A0A928YX52_9GAMM|nr:tryptophan halogenase family protein [Cellvibrio polysaccharolyticus]MBE8718978.1 tryptophan 7-halogenase [Cellvibrio polysaccharolyticus]
MSAPGTQLPAAPDALQRIVIVGGGTAGWLAAAMLTRQIKPAQCRIEVVESEQLGRIGLGESTIPPFVGLLKSLGIDEQDFIRKTGATYKLGIRFVDWKQKNSQYFHPFGVIGARIDSQDFYQCWLKARHLGHPWELQEFSPCAVMAAQGRFLPPNQAYHSPIAGAGYALHVDARYLADYFRHYAEAAGVQRTEGLVSQVTTANDDGRIETLILADGREISGDFFIDCTGFKSLLLGKTLGVAWQDWSHLLPCDRAVAVKSDHHHNIPPFTQATARESGWSWQIPLQQNTGYGYVYSSQFCSDEKARRQLLKLIDGSPVNEVKTIPFATGCHDVLWQKNCLALGLAAGFIEPLESTAIHLIARGMDFFLRYYPDKHCKPALIAEYNRRMRNDFEEVRDFVLLHYCTTQRDDSPFWQHCRNLPLPDSLQARMELFKASGAMREGLDELFRQHSWQSIFEGMGLRPDHYCARVDNSDFEQIRTTLTNARQAIAAMVNTLPSHDAFLAGLHKSAANGKSV